MQSGNVPGQGLGHGAEVPTIALISCVLPNLVEQCCFPAIPCEKAGAGVGAGTEGHRAVRALSPAPSHGVSCLRRFWALHALPLCRPYPWRLLEGAGPCPSVTLACRSPSWGTCSWPQLLGGAAGCRFLGGHGGRRVPGATLFGELPNAQHQLLGPCLGGGVGQERDGHLQSSGSKKGHQGTGLGSCPQVIDAISQAVTQTPGCVLLDVDTGPSTNRTVYTFVGRPQDVVEGALNAARAASRLIDMRRHKGGWGRWAGCP